MCHRKYQIRYCFNSFEQRVSFIFRCLFGLMSQYYDYYFCLILRSSQIELLPFESVRNGYKFIYIQFVNWSIEKCIRINWMRSIHYMMLCAPACLPAHANSRRHDVICSCSKCTNLVSMEHETWMNQKCRVFIFQLQRAVCVRVCGDKMCTLICTQVSMCHDVMLYFDPFWIDAKL